jgi:serine/threonine protein kinase/tetratricopeptide (TPR) repeat protein
MQAAPWDQVKEIFLAATELDPDQRDAFLSDACAGNTALREKVDRLLTHHDHTQTVELVAPPHYKRTLAEGEILCDRFKILEFVGRGGMGEVYRAADLELGGDVALKILRPDLLSDPQFLVRFRREVQLARQVTHPNVCRIFDVGRHHQDDREIAFLTMEFLPGETLSQRMKSSGRMLPESVMPLARQIAEGLSALHQCNIVHRDFKPGNIMIVPASGSVGERAVITDFGLARSTEPSSPGDALSLSRSSQILGTPEYMAPEQLLGKPVTPAADVFAFGIMLYELVTGKKPFPSGRTVESAIERLQHEPDPPRQHAPQLADSWNTTILRCLSRSPEERPVTPEAIIEGLNGNLPTSPATQARRRRRISHIGITAAAVFVLLAGLLAISRLPYWSRWSAFGGSRQHVAVLAFNVPDNNTELRMFADGLVEDITIRLSQYEGTNTRLMVVPASEVRRQAAQTATDARAKFGANEVIEGSVQTRGDRVRLVMTLVDTDTVTQTGSVVLEDQMSNAFVLQDTAVERLAEALRLRVRGQGSASLAAPAPGAYEYYLQARGYLQRNDQIQNVERAVDLLKRAVAIDSKFAPAYSGLALAHFYRFQETRDPGTLDLALAAGSQSLQLAPDLPEGNIAMGRIYYGTGRHDEAREIFTKAIAADPRNNEAYQGLAAAYFGLKDFAKAEATYRKAITMRPADWTGYKALGLFFYERENYEKAAEQFRRVVELTPDNSQGFVNLGAAEAGRENWTAAERAWLRALALDPKSAGTLSNLGKIYLDRGETAQAVKMYRESLDLNPRSYRAWGQLGRAYRRLGETNAADQAFTKALEILEAELLINPKRFTLHSTLAFYRALMGRNDFVAPVQTALDLAPANAEVIERAAETYAIAGQKDRARQTLESAAARGIHLKSVQRSEYLKDVISGK